MTKKQLHQLIDDHDIEPGLFEYDEDTGKYYCPLELPEAFSLINPDISYDIISGSFLLHASDYCDRFIDDTYADEITDILRFSETSKESKKVYLEKLLKVKVEEKRMITFKAMPPDAVLKDMFLGVQTNTEGKINVEACWKWLSATMLEPKIFRFLKFDVFKGKRIKKSLINISDQELADSLFREIGSKKCYSIFQDMIGLRQIRYLQRQIRKLGGVSDEQPEGKTGDNSSVRLKRADTINTSEISIFCLLINEVSEPNSPLKKTLSEDQGQFCERVCKEFGLKYSDKVRQKFGYYGNYIHVTTDYFEKIARLILPKIDAYTRKKIEQHLDSKKTLYG